MPPGYSEKLNIIFMRDNGPRSSIRMRRSHYYVIIAFFACLPFLCVLLAAQCWMLWKENAQLRDNIDKFEVEFQKAEAIAEKLENLRELLDEDNTPGREIVVRQIAGAEKKTEGHSPNMDAAAMEGEAAQDEGPGHEDFPALDTGRVKVGNVQARALRGNSLRIALDLRNPDNENMLSGEVEATLVTVGGERIPLRFDRRDMGNFRINHFKRAVMISKLPPDTPLDNSEVIVEVRDQAQKTVYRNIFAVQR